jgi:hypothetical protein
MTVSQRLSQLGQYSGFGEPAYDSYERTSRYVEVRDGVKLAIDIYRPTKDGVVETQPLPVVWTAKRYLRATIEDGKLTSSLVQGGMIERPAPRRLLSYGYVLVSADMRGTGASFGGWSECSDPSVANDGYDINEWIAEQPWCDGKIGMFGASYEGRMQYSVASTAPPHLVAIMPEVSPFDWYSEVSEGGGYSKRFIDTGTHFRACDMNVTVAPVDDDIDGSMQRAALADHEELNDYSATSGKLAYRDSVNAKGVRQWLERSGDALLAGIERSGVASYHTSGWFAPVGREELLWFANMERSKSAGKHRVLMGPWPGGGVAGAAPEFKDLWAVETHRFMDHWLKGVDNGIMDEPPVVYSTMDSEALRTVHEWRFAEEWPVSATSTTFNFAAGRSGSSESANDGRLVEGDVDAGSDSIAVNYDVAAPFGDWHFNGNFGSDLSSYDNSCLTYTTEPFDEEFEVTGYPLVTLFLSLGGDAENVDADVNVHLEDVHEDGSSNYVTFRRLRVSHRAESPAPCYNFELPYHAHFESDLKVTAPGEVVELSIDLRPTSYKFQVGHRLRLSIAGADEYESAPPVDKAKDLALYRGGNHRSRIVLPVVDSSSRKAKTEAS